MSNVKAAALSRTSLLGCLLLASACAIHEPLVVKTWPVVDPAAQGQPPRPHLPGARPPEMGIPALAHDLAQKEDLGLAFSGGGTVSSVATSGELAALKQMHLLEKARYISCVSGGTWGALPFVYLNSETADAKGEVAGEHLSQEQLEDRYLGMENGRVRMPKDLTVADLDVPKKQLKHGSALRMACNTGFAVHLLNLRGSESFAHMLSTTFLKPIGLGDESHYFTWTRDYYEKELRSRAGVPDAGKFYFATHNRPYLIANSALDRGWRTTTLEKIWGYLFPDYYNSVCNGFWPLEITPAYTGMWVYTDHHDPNPTTTKGNTIFCEKPAGGGYIESFGYDSKFLQWENSARNSAKVRLSYADLAPRRKREFSLADTLAASGSAPAAALGELVEYVGLRPRFDTFPTWPSKTNTQHIAASYPHADGGSCDNTGLTALLARGVRHVIVFINAASAYDNHCIPPITKGKKQATQEMCDYSPGKHLTSSLTSLFGKFGQDDWRDGALNDLVTNHVLEDENESRLVELDRAFVKCVEEKRPLVYCADYTTLSQASAQQERKAHHNCCGLDRYGIQPGMRVRICWVYLTARERNRKPSAGRGEIVAETDPWIHELKPEVQGLFTDEKLVKKHGLAQFPALDTFFPSGLATGVQDLDPVAATGLASYASFNLLHPKSQAIVRSVLGHGP